MSAPEIIPAEDPHRMAQAIATIQASYVTHQDLMHMQTDLIMRMDALRADLTLAIDRRINDLTRTIDIRTGAQSDAFHARIDSAVERATRTINKWGIGLVVTLLIGMSPLYAMVFSMSHELGALGERVAGQGQAIVVLQRDVGVLKQDVSVLKQDVSVLKQDVSVLKQDVSVLKQDVSEMKQDLVAIKSSLAALQKQQKPAR